MAGTGHAHLRDEGTAVLRVQDLVVEFPAGHGQRVHAVSGISLDVYEGETLGLVGESGCGKSTTGRAIMQVPRPTGGSVRLHGEELTTLHGEALRKIRPKMQMVFQNPISSLNPRRRIHDIISQPLAVWGVDDVDARTALVRRILDEVGLDPDDAMKRRPHEFSGGQCQRISIARALALEPELLICDEPVSALDVSVQAQILTLLESLKARHKLTMIFIAHDLAVVKNISDRVAVMYMGKLCEVAPANQLYEHPTHPYTQGLINSIPIPDPEIARRRQNHLRGEIPSPLSPPSGCRFRTRCQYADEKCAAAEPVLRAVSANHFVACHHAVYGGEPRTGSASVIPA
jgi:peptide/nickel transport system ATP-binding protein